MPEPSPQIFPHLKRFLREWNELARLHNQFDIANSFKSMARQAGPEDVALLLDEILTLWGELRRAKAWEMADQIRFDLQGVPGLIIEDRGGAARWRFADEA